MSISGIGSLISPVIQSVLTMRSQLDDLQRQLGTGQKAATFSGLGSQSGLTVGLNAQLSAIGSFDDTMTNVGTRVSLAQTALTQIASVASNVKAGTLQPKFDVDSTGQTTVQKTAQNQLDEMLGLLNTQVGDRYLFSGSGVNQASVDTTDHILNGNGAQAGLKTLIAQRNQADLGANGMGRLVIPAPTATVATLVGSGATLKPDQATGTGVAVPGGNATLLSSLGVTTGHTITVSDGTNTTNYVVPNNATVGNLIAGLSNQPGGANVTLSIAGGKLQIQSNDITSTITVSDSAAGADTTALGFGPGNTTFTPNTLLSQGAVTAGQTLTIQVGTNPPNAPTNITFGTNPGQVSTLTGLNAALASLAGGTASVNPANGNLSVTATSTSDVITIGGTANAANFGVQSTTVPPTGGLTLSEDVAGSVFGFKLGSVSSTLTGATVTGPAGSPASISVSFGATNANNGDTIKFNLNLPDGSTEVVALQASTTVPLAAGQFAIGTTPAATAANLQAALTTAVGKLAQTSLSAASAMAAADNFFNTDATHPPLRVAGPPYNTATSLVAGTPANTVSWYTGENGNSLPRSTATARVDTSITVSYGMRANEQGIRWLVQNVAVLAATSYAPGNANAPASYAALNQRVDTALAVPAGTQKIDDIEASIASAQTAMKSASDRHAQTKNTLTDMLQQIQGVTQEQVGSEILSLQTTLQASLQVTAKLSQINLLNYLPPG